MALFRVPCLWLCTGMASPSRHAKSPITGSDSRSIRNSPVRIPARSAALDQNQSSAFSNRPRRTGFHGCVVLVWQLSRNAIMLLTYRNLRLRLLFGSSADRYRCIVRVISKRRLREFWESRKADSARAQRDLSAWYKMAKDAEWENFGSLRQTFGSADQVGNCVVFDVGNNRFRLIGRVNYTKGIVYVLSVMDHREYDRKSWIDDCGCHKPPPKRPPGEMKVSISSPVSRKPKGRR